MASLKKIVDVKIFLLVLVIIAVNVSFLFGINMAELIVI